VRKFDRDRQNEIIRCAGWCKQSLYCRVSRARRSTKWGSILFHFVRRTGMWAFRSRWRATSAQANVADRRSCVAGGGCEGCISRLFQWATPVLSAYMYTIRYVHVSQGGIFGQGFHAKAQRRKVRILELWLKLRARSNLNRQGRLDCDCRRWRGCGASREQGAWSREWGIY
jgi:hypothetical protein